YFGTPNGLFQQFEQIKKVSGQIRLMNQENMKEAARDARATAAASRVWLAAGLVVATLLAGLMVWHTARSLLRPIQEVTRAAQPMGAGTLAGVVPPPPGNELVQPAEAFTRMTAQLRDYRRSNTARLLRAQRTGQATVDSFPDPVLVIDPDGRVEM